MVKKKVGGAKRYQKAAGSDGSSQLAKRPGPPPPKHLQRKITKKVGFLEKVAASNSSKLGLKQAGVSKKKSKGSPALHNLSSLSGVLDEVTRDVQQAADVKYKKQSAHRAFGEAVHSSKTRANIQTTETARIQQVLHHPMFQANPITAITNHLKSTLPPPPAAQNAGKQAGRNKQERKKGSKQRKKQREADMEAD